MPKRDASPKLAYDELGHPVNVSPNEPAAEWVDLATLKPWPKNPRKNDATVAKVALAVKELGWGAPILARREDREVVAGHTRLRAVEQLRKEYRRASQIERDEWHKDAVRVATANQAPVRFGDWSKEEARLLALADNRIAEESTWDKDVLKDVLADIGRDDAAIAGFDGEELDRLLAEPTESDVTEVDVSDVQDEFWLSVRGKLPREPDALEMLRRALEGIDGVTVDVSTTVFD